MTQRRPWTTAEVAKIRALGRNMDVHGIAKELGRTARAVDSMAERAGISLRALREWSAADDEVLRQQVGKLSAAEIGALVRLSADAVKRRAKELGVSLKRCGQYHHAAKHTDEMRQQYRTLRADGAAQQTAARIVGVHPATARRWEAA